MDSLDQLLQKYSRPAYQALLSSEPLDATSPQLAIASRFGGAPYFEQGESWPVCSKCQKQETFICQLDLRACPAVRLPECYGLLSFFYCFNCFPWDAPQPGWTVRNHQYASPDKAIVLAAPIVSESGFFKKALGQRNESTRCCLINFELFNCYPQLDELDELGDALERKMLAGDDFSDNYYQLVDKLTGKSDNFGTIIGGYSQWIQNFPPDLKCKLCDNWMRQLVQIGSHREANVMFGDAGCIYLSICDKHPLDVSMVLQCF